MSKTTKYPTLKAEIKKRQEHSQKVLRFAIQNSTDHERHCAWCDKREYGEVTRGLLLAYVYLRGMPHYAAEQKTTTNKHDLVDLILHSLQGEVWDSLSEEDKAKCSRENLSAWIDKSQRVLATHLLGQIIDTLALRAIEAHERTTGG